MWKAFLCHNVFMSQCEQGEHPKQTILTNPTHCCDVIMGAMASQITSLTIVYSTVHSGPDQRKHQSSASLAFVRAIHRLPVNSTHKWPVTRKMFPFDDAIMNAPIISHNTPFRTEMCPFLFWMVFCGIWERCIVGFVRMAYFIWMRCMSRYPGMPGSNHYSYRVRGSVLILMQRQII